MHESTWKRLGLSVTAVALLAGVTACGGGEKDDKGASGASTKAEKPAAAGVAAEAVNAAFRKTQSVKSAKFKMTMKVPGLGDQPVTLESSGVMGWDPAVVDQRVAGLPGKDGAAAESRVITIGSVTYTDVGPEAAAKNDGKRWLKMDVAEMAKESGGDSKALQQLMGGGQGQSQDPAKQMALLKESPNVKLVGEETVEGKQARHYKGTLTADEAVKSNKSLEGLDEKDRQQLLDSIKQAGITQYDMDVWVNSDDLPVKLVMNMDTVKGRMEITQNLSDFGAKADVQAPPAEQTVDLLEKIKKMKETGDTPSLSS
ncbi:hypothetical protein FGW37_14315 [Streptomyces rectiverticillatus]|uniref:hypothetical protein n=1 Tax=Streptomyces rectiverticillatus TaxID=173860 RepID=UPI0015C372CE|nr:hypothetical protein [Streptomyces rectiverticillatus]QLE72619.1 hypothetical protein FGW37_14315 [Streptomyces rectiverticillatus]